MSGVEALFRMAFIMKVNRRGAVCIGHENGIYEFVTKGQEGAFRIEVDSADIDKNALRLGAFADQKAREASKFITSIRNEHLNKVFARAVRDSLKTEEVQAAIYGGVVQ